MTSGDKVYWSQPHTGCSPLTCALELFRMCCNYMCQSFPEVMRMKLLWSQYGSLNMHIQTDTFTFCMKIHFNICIVEAGLSSWLFDWTGICCITLIFLYVCISHNIYSVEINWCTLWWLHSYKSCQSSRFSLNSGFFGQLLHVHKLWANVPFQAIVETFYYFFRLFEW